MRSSERFIVIASNSFSGASFVDYVLRDNPDAEIIGISRSPEYPDCFLPYKKIAGERFQFRQLDMNRHLNEIITVVRDFHPAYIVNFAAQGMVAESWNNPEEWFQTNCIALMNLANQLSEERYLKRFVQISSPEVYGSCQNFTEEDVRLRPSSPYAASKACGDLSLYPFFLNKAFPVVYTRATNVYGHCQQLFRIIPRTILSIRKGIKMPLQGGGKAVKSYIHIRDVCDATLRIARNGRSGEVYHISPDGEGISIYDLIKIICEKMGRKIENCVEIVGDRLGQDAKYVINSDKVRKELGWRQKVELNEGINEVIAWVNEYYDELSKMSMIYIHKK